MRISDWSSDVCSSDLQTGVTALWTVGRLSQHASRAFGEGARHFSDQAALIEGLQQALSERDQQGPLQVLVKGSRSSAMEHVVAALCPATAQEGGDHADRKSTRLNSSH